MPPLVTVRLPERILLVGECNPYRSDPAFAPYPLPPRAAGGRLAEILGLDTMEYLRKFDRRNLCVQTWNKWLAKASADEILASGRRKIVMLGTRVARAFGANSQPFATTLCVPGKTLALALPHPSGRCRVWNDPRAAGRALGILGWLEKVK